MKFFKDINNEVFAYEEDGSQDYLVGNKTPITKAEADEIINARQQSEFFGLPYTQKRAMEYPPIGDQLDALFHAGVFPPEMASKIQAVKDKYPKS